MDATPVSTTREGAVATITLARPGARNALTTEVKAALRDALETVAEVYGLPLDHLLSELEAAVMSESTLKEKRYGHANHLSTGCDLSS